MRRLLVTAALAAAALAAASAGPAQAALTVPPGVRVAAVARGVGQPTNLAFDAQGGLWTTSGGNVTVASDGVWYTRRPGARPVHVVRRLFTALGLTWFRDELYVSFIAPYSAANVPHTGQVNAYGGWDGQRFRRSRVVVRNLPIGEHTVDSITPGPDGRLYLGVGSKFNAKAVPLRLSGTVVSFLPSGGGLRVEGRGFRNPYGLAFVPGTSDLLVTENGRDDLGAFKPHDELDLVRTPRRGAIPFYGFPGCYGQGGAPCRGAVAPLLLTAVHASSDGIAITKRFGSFGLSAFIAENGSSFAANPTGSDVIRVSLVRRGRGYRAVSHRFARGFTKYDPLGAAMGPGGALYVTLWKSGKVIRFTPPR